MTVFMCVSTVYYHICDKSVYNLVNKHTKETQEGTKREGCGRWSTVHVSRVTVDCETASTFHRAINM